MILDFFPQALDAYRTGAYAHHMTYPLPTEEPTMTHDLTPITISLDIEQDLAYAGVRSVSLPERLGEGFDHWAAITADHPSDAGWSSQEMAQARWDAAMDTLAERWTRAARAAGAHLGYDVTVVECQPQRQTITLCDDGTTVENAIWQCAHDATAVA